MKPYLTLMIAAATAIAFTATAASYSTEATITPLPDSGQYRVDVRVSRLVEQHGKQVEELWARPRILSGVGCPASFYEGLQPSNPDYWNQDNVSVDVSWPYPKESGTAFCTVTVRHGDEVVSKSKLQLQITGPGRVPLVLSPETVDAKSVRVQMDSSRGMAYLLLEFSGKTKAEARSMAIENLGNKAQIQDRDGHLVGSGFITGTYEESGLALSYHSEDEATRMANVLAGTPVK